MSYSPSLQGKYGWGTAGDEEPAPAALDPKDPNFEDPEDLEKVSATESGEIAEAK